MPEDGETEDQALLARKKLGTPEYDPNGSLLGALPKILHPGLSYFF